MKFKKLGIQIRGHDLYIDFECNLKESIKKDILDGVKMLNSQKTKDSVPNQFKPNQDLFKNLFR